MSRSDPVAAFREIAATRPRMFWLDGGGSRDWSGRRSYLGWLDDDDVSLTYDAARREVRRHAAGSAALVGDDIFTALEAEIARDGGDPSISWVGYFGYACRPDLPALADRTTDRKPDRAPDAVWMRSPRQLVFEHPAAELSERMTAMAVTHSDNSEHSGGVPDEYRRWFERVQEQLRLGNSYEVNLTYRRAVESRVDPASAYLRLRRVNPAPYAGYLQHHGSHLLSSSPERFATIDRHRWVETKPIKGTAPRDEAPDEDQRQAEVLRTDPKNRSENLMVVDLLRNDLSIVCEPGTVTVPALMQVESYASVHQLVSTVRGRLRDDIGTISALRALFPAGSMTGAPKLRTMEIIADVETTPRGVYAGAFGWIGGDGRADLGVVIRALVATPGQAPHQPPDQAPGHGPRRYELGTGGAITVRSRADSEYAETLWKAARLLSALD